MLQGIRALLFDLDGTLLDLDIDTFLPEYVKALSLTVATAAGPKRLAHELMRASACMLEDTDATTTNREVFSREFYPALELTEEELLPAITDFYENHFPALRRLSRPIAGAKEVVDAAKARGYLLVLATNPVFPLPAIKQRLEWAGIGAELFDYVASYEDLHACKPHRSYFLELAERVGCSPHECLMIGNDVDDDLAAAEVGMKTYLTSSHQINPRNIEPACDYAGSLEQLRMAIEGANEEVGAKTRVSV